MSNDVVISVEGLGKCYQIAHLEKGAAGKANTLSERIQHAAAWPLRVLKRKQEVKRSTEEFWALKDVGFEVKRGEVLGIIGRNGAGKSTLLKVLSRITEPTRGEIRLRGKLASLLEVGTGFHPELTGRENIFLNGAILGMSRQEIRARFDEIVEFAAVAKFLDTPVKHYSSGMYVRLAFAVAAHLRTEILIIDEVLAVGDMEFQKKCLGKMGEVTKDGRTVLFVSHNMQAVSTLTTRCLLMQKGSCVFQGSTREAISAYLEDGVSAGTAYMPGKEPKGVAYVSKAEVLTSEPGGTHAWGQPLKFVFEITAKAPLQNASFSFHILDPLQQPVVHSWVFDSEQPMLRSPGVFRLECTLPAPRLYMGQYTITTYLADALSKSMTESVEGICSFQVVMHGKHREWAWQEGACKYLEDWDWNVKTPTAS
ncbi:ABC transporter ATP-binding protein [Prosthecobacter sp.]|uniref:ABC transporter ATP-binding protein n=1 Tax=Prosthecobacter sp. TaxID=1965333 RepID=UPI0037836586